ncbi:peptidoglycan endopeptidase [Flavobacterium sp. ZB4P23]|uniref:peptidoglycan endopeptidase n=1 Tax=Flavobacterium sp. ZB4P23 TaxID=2497484 RepID=UPI000F83A56F|nr:peptidoglycan endopeptidase [Flavobacterium sp. ZB4P23]RTY83325.1 peptidoglycan endopeptidase [Flavobacterium sp. ZB4P23]
MSVRVIVAFFLFNSIVLFSQEKIIKHTIVKGETISSIAERYEVKQSAIYKLNPKAKNLLKLNSVLLIPIIGLKKTTTKTNTPLKYATKEHEVLAKQTPYGIAKEYGISLAELNQSNPELEAKGLQIGQKITIPGTAVTTSKVVVSPSKKATFTPEIVLDTEATNKQISEILIREVLSKETKYSIAKQYGITIGELDKANPAIGVKPLRVGQKINIPWTQLPVTQIAVVLQEEIKVQTAAPKASLSVGPVVPEITTTVVLQSKNDAPVLSTEGEEKEDFQRIVREVMPKETKYSIAKQYGITVKELEKQNPDVKRKLPIGYKLMIQSPRVLLENNNAEGNGVIAQTKPELHPFTKPVFNHDFLDQLIEHASENIGTRYRMGGTTKSGFDCSGLMCTTFEAFDIKLPRTSIAQSGFGTKINTEEAKKGDLIFFKTNGRRQINHVGMVVEVCEGEIKFIHASVSSGVIISSTKEKYYEKNFTQINRVLQ